MNFLINVSIKENAENHLKRHFIQEMGKRKYFGIEWENNRKIFT